MTKEMTPTPQEKKYCCHKCAGIFLLSGSEFDTCPCHTPSKTEEWMIEFEQRKQNWRKDFNFWQQDIKDFISNLLSRQRKELVYVIKKRVGTKEHICGFNDGVQSCNCYNAALSDLLSLLQDTNNKDVQTP